MWSIRFKSLAFGFAIVRLNSFSLWPFEEVDNGNESWRII